MSKGEILRGFVTERLAAASREILAAVEGLVAGYEEEIDRQRRQLDVLRQPQVTLNKTGVKRSWNLHNVEEEERENEDDKSLKNLEDLKNKTLSRVHFKQRKHVRPQIGESQKHVDLRIRILEEPRTEILSKNVLRKCPMLRLRCPRGLQEMDFLDLLRSTFPQLAGDNKTFDMLLSNKRRRLKHLKVKTVTPGEIQRNLSSAGSGSSTLFIRLKAQKEQITVAPFRRLKAAEWTLCPAAQHHNNNNHTQQDMVTEEADDEDCWVTQPAEHSVVCCVAKTKGGTSEERRKKEDREEVNDSDDNWTPDKCDEELKESDSELQSKNKRHKPRRSEVRTSETKTENSDTLSCKVCSVLHESEVTFVKHAWSHVDDPGSLCAPPVEDGVDNCNVALHTGQEVKQSLSE
ncbi:hypothetical protein INR49_001219 [Caranx melampygus]|nr:hypothetical protein INR49_001219 [Caranx melampygus]